LIYCTGRVASFAKPACDCSTGYSRRERTAGASVPRLFGGGEDEGEEVEVEGEVEK
jgi:hypothetical protein